jgi:hypothetical protein
MTTSLDDLMKVMVDAEKEASAGGGFKTIAMVEMKLGYQVFSSPPTFYPYVLHDEKSRQLAAVEAKVFAEANGIKFNERNNHGVATIIAGGDNRLTHPASGTRIEFEIVNFVAAWQGDSCKLTDEELAARGSAKMPYTAVMDGIKAANAVSLFDAPQWCMLRQEVDGFQKAKGRKQQDKHDDTKSYDWRVYVIEKVYANKAEAEAEAEQLQSGGSGSVAAADSNSDGLSELAVENKWTKESLFEVADTLNNQLSEALKGNGINGEKLTGMSPKKAQEYVAKSWSITVEDLALIVPF